MLARMLDCMPSTSVRIDRATHEELKRLARELGTTVGEAVAIAARRLRQQRIGKELRSPLTKDEVDWLDADLG
jgi:antitoxin component of RelBE/YafQ-DinJ toxin-antitoxin module